MKGRQTINSTINVNGINDGTYPVQSFGTSNVNVVNNSNVIQNVPSSTAGTITPSGGGGVVVGGGTIVVGGGTSPTPGGGTGTGGGGGGGCLIAGTKIRMWNGTTKNVENIQKGDLLTGYDLKKPFAPFVVVQELKPNNWNQYYVINNRLKITYEHPVMVKDKVVGDHTISGLVEVRKLEVGDNMVRYDGTTEAITSITTVDGQTPTYNFIVDANHLYIAEDIVVHNPLVQKF